MKISWKTVYKSFRKYPTDHLLRIMEEVYYLSETNKDYIDNLYINLISSPNFPTVKEKKYLKPGERKNNKIITFNECKKVINDKEE